MFYKGIIFDLDDTLYNYKVCHEHALQTIFKYLYSVYSGINSDFENTYLKITTDLKKELSNTASSHNKSIYFKHLLEKLNYGLSDFLTIQNLYWQSFYERIECYPGVKDFILWNRNKKIKIGILTDYETEYQIIKLEKLGLLDYVDVIVTSEEVGKEKPSKQMFLTALFKMGLSCENVIMVGDNFEKDINGAIDMGIFAFWLTNNVIVDNPQKFIPFNNFESLLTNFVSIHKDLTELEKISKFCGERFDLVQAGGGNTSVKTLYGWMAIKASGYNLTNVDTKNGFIMVQNDKLIEDIKIKQIKEITNYNALGSKRRPSIETFMHSLLKKFTVHLHPIQVNRILVCENSRAIINNIYPNSIIIDYLTPGIQVCNKIKDVYHDQNVIFLLNHGIILTSDNVDEVYELIDDILIKFEKQQGLVDFDKYKFTNTVSANINTKFNMNNVSYLVNDSVINRYLTCNKGLFYTKTTFPDALVYCGETILDGLANIDQCKEAPKIIIEKNSVYICANTLAKCKEIEDVLKSFLIIADSDLKKNYLNDDEIYFLNNWDAEKYRKIV